MAYNGANIVGLERMDSTPFSFDYQIRINRRARRAQIKVTHTGQVVVVLPRPVAEPRVQALVSEHRCWIETRLTALAEQVERLPDQLGLRPQTVDLQAIDQQWQVHYEQPILRPWQALADRRQLQLRAGPDAEADVRQSLQRWLHRQARQILPAWLADVSRRTGLEYTGVTIRAQKTRWGSCSARGNINLNRNLLFLSPELVEYLLVHELCHTRHPNHSADYWALVESYLADYRQRDRALRRAVQNVPLWAHA